MAASDVGVVVEGVEADLALLHPGDLLFFNRSAAGRVSHVGIYLGTDTLGRHRFVHSASKPDGPIMGDRAPGRPAILDAVHWLPRLASVKRV